MMQVLYARPYNFEDDKTGRKVSGCKIVYLGEPSTDLSRAKGQEPVTITAPEEVYYQLPPLPAKLDLDIVVTMSQGKPKVSCRGLLIPKPGEAAQK